MKMLFLYCFTFLFTIAINAQPNLVPNPSFEVFSSCAPINVGYGGPCCPIGWDNPTGSTPDYYNFSSSCNLTGFQCPRTGEAFVGFYALGEGPVGSFEIRDYVQIQLGGTLIVGKKYCVEFYVSLADMATVAVTQIGSYFSNTAISAINMFHLPYTAQIVSPTGIFITDTINWVKVVGTYTAIGGEKYITIGNFNDAAHTDTINTTNTGQRSSYYYLDDVSVECCNCDSTASVHESNNDVLFKLYPNPNNGNMMLDYALSTSDKGVIMIYDIAGKLIYKYRLDASANQIIINHEGFNNGIYFYQIKVNNSIVKSDKLIIIK